MKVLIANGVNLGKLGKRRGYGSKNLADIENEITSKQEDCQFEFFQSNHEGAFIDRIEQDNYDVLILNAGAWTHTSLALADCLENVDAKIIEVHITNIFSREKIRQTSLLSKHCDGFISGFGPNVYKLAVESIRYIDHG